MYVYVVTERRTDRLITALLKCPTLYGRGIIINTNEIVDRIAAQSQNTVT